MRAGLPTPYAEAMERADNEASRLDVVTVAQQCRRGAVSVHVSPTSNGFFVTLSGRDVNDDFVFTRPEYVGQLMHALYNANLENAMVAKRLRRLMGYK